MVRGTVRGVQKPKKTLYSPVQCVSIKIRHIVNITTCNASSFTNTDVLTQLHNAHSDLHCIVSSFLVFTEPEVDIIYCLKYAARRSGARVVN